MESKLSPWSNEPDAPGVLILGTAPRTLTGGIAVCTAQARYVSLCAAQHDFPHTVREVLERKWNAARTAP
jgi:hypothetical protein